MIRPRMISHEAGAKQSKLIYNQPSKKVGKIVVKENKRGQESRVKEKS